MEQIITFKNKNDERLYGIVNIPENNSSRIGVVLLNTGLNYRIAWHRLNVKIGRFLCNHGYFVLRFDTHGIGDSEGELKEGIIVDHFVNIQKGIFVNDTLAGLDYFIKQNKLHKVYLAGLCGGALTAIFAANKDCRVDGIIPIAGPVTLSSSKLEEENHPWQAGALLLMYINKILNMNAWLRLLTGKSEYKKLGIALKSVIKHKLSSIRENPKDLKVENDASHPSLNTDFIDAFQKYCKSKKQILFLFAERDQATWEFETMFRKKFIDDNPHANALCNVKIIKDTNHIFSSDESQENLLTSILIWLKERDGF